MARRQTRSWLGQSSAESLETRRVPAASATMIGSTLVVNGTEGNDNIQVGGLDTGNISVQINGGQGLSFHGVKNIKIDAKGGNDRITVAAAVTGDLEVKAGSGDDSLNVSGRYGNDVTIDMGNEQFDQAVLDATIRDLGIGDDLTVKSSLVTMSAKDNLWFQNFLTVGDQVNITSPSVAKSVVFLDGHAGNVFTFGKLNVNTSAAAKSDVMIQLLRVNTTTDITTGNGDDLVSSSFSTLGTQLKISTNGGTDRVYLNRVNAGSLIANGGAGSSDFLYQFGNNFGSRLVSNFELFSF